MWLCFLPAVHIIVPPKNMNRLKSHKKDIACYILLIMVLLKTYTHNSFYRNDMVKKKVVIRIREDKAKLKERMCLAEHPFGTVKWYNGAHYVLCRGKEKVTGEMGLAFLVYNIR